MERRLLPRKRLLTGKCVSCLSGGFSRERERCEELRRLPRALADIAQPFARVH